MKRVAKIRLEPTVQPTVQTQKNKPNLQLGMDFLSAVSNRKKERARELFAQALKETKLPEDASDEAIRRLALYENESTATRNLLEDHLNLNSGALLNVLNNFLRIKV